MKKRVKKIISMAMTAILAVSAVTATGIVNTTQVQAASEPQLATGVKNTATNRVSVHDPSVVYGNDGYYYIFGSHMAWAKSKDLTSWTTFTTNINTNYSTVFKTPGTWAARGSSSYDISGNLWAPDVIYNPTMKKWCMYMSVNGDSYCSSIALATADSITGPYTYEGTVVYSGFTNASARSYTYTDYQKATGSTNISRFLTGGSWNPQYGTNAIDPCVIYDENGDLWMSYGSWFGGIYMLKLDNTTGLRDYTYTYSTVTNQSDAYMGVKLAGGYGQSGEGSYIVYDEEAGYYYLYLSYCGLDATDDFSGYHLRMYRSKNIAGPYTDAAGNSAIYTSAEEDQSTHGVKLFGNYSFSSLSGNGENSKSGYMSGGHNSAFIDSDGNHFLVYHTRFNLGTEAHEVRVHQQFLNEDGWLVTAPYEYRGSKISETGYRTEDIIGCYELINHGLAATTTYTGMLSTLQVILMENGTITGDVSGTWSEKEGTYYASMTVEGVDYKGVFFKQYDESSSHKEVMTFSLIGEDNTSIWGSKISDVAELNHQAADTLFTGSVSSSILIPSFGSATVEFSTDSEYLTVSEDGTQLIYHAPEKDTTVKVTEKITVSGKTQTYTTDVLVRGWSDTANHDNLIAYYSFDGTLTADNSENQYTATNYGVTKATDAERGSVAYFNGSSAYIQLPSSVTNTDNFTFMAWVKSTNTSSWERIFDFGDSEGNSLFLTTHGYNPECVRAAYAVGAVEQTADSGSTLITGKWVNLAVTVDSVNKKMSIYIDGQLAGSASLTSNITTNFSGTKNYLGKSQYSADALFNGYLDDVRIFDTALSAKEISQYMNGDDTENTISLSWDTGFAAVPSGKHITMENDTNDTFTTTDSSVAKVCSDGAIKTVSDGRATITATAQDGTVKTFTILVEENQDVDYGDLNQDGQINVLDMEKLQKHLLDIDTMSQAQVKAAGITGSTGKLSVLDMEIIQKHTLGIEKITQIKK